MKLELFFYKKTDVSLLLGVKRIKMSVNTMKKESISNACLKPYSAKKAENRIMSVFKKNSL